MEDTGRILHELRFPIVQATRLEDNRRGGGRSFLMSVETGAPIRKNMPPLNSEPPSSRK